MVNGNTKGIKRGDTYQRNFKITQTSKSFPANSEIYSQMVCRTKMNIKITKTLTKVFKYVINMYRSSIFKTASIQLIDVVSFAFVFCLIESEQGFGEGFVGLE